VVKLGNANVSLYEVRNYKKLLPNEHQISAVASVC